MMGDDNLIEGPLTGGFRSWARPGDAKYQTVTIDLDRDGKDGSIAVDGVKVKKTFGESVSSAIGKGNHLRIESWATTQTIRAVIALLEGLIEGSDNLDALRRWCGGITIDGYPLAELDSVSLIIERDSVVHLVVAKQVEELDLTFLSLRGKRERSGATMSRDRSAAPPTSLMLPDKSTVSLTQTSAAATDTDGPVNYFRSWLPPAPGGSVEWYTVFPGGKMEVWSCHYCALTVENGVACPEYDGEPQLLFTEPGA